MHDAIMFSKQQHLEKQFVSRNKRGELNEFVELFYISEWFKLSKGFGIGPVNSLSW